MKEKVRADDFSLVLFQTRRCGGVFDWYLFSWDGHVRRGAHRESAVCRTFIASTTLRAFSELRRYI